MLGHHLDQWADRPAPDRQSLVAPVLRPPQLASVVGSLSLVGACFHQRCQLADHFAQLAYLDRTVGREDPVVQLAAIV
jgi:hypothetical protein